MKYEKNFKNQKLNSNNKGGKPLFKGPIQT